MNSQKTLIYISAILLILSIFLTIFNRIYAFPKAGADFVDFMTHFYDMKQFYKKGEIPTTGARFQMGPLTEEVAPRVPGGFFYIHYLLCYKLAGENLEIARVFNFITMFIPALIFLFWIYKRFGFSIASILSCLVLFNIYFVYTNNIFYNPNITLSLSFLFLTLFGEYINIYEENHSLNIPAMMFFPCLALMGQAHFGVYYGIVPTVIIYLIIRFKSTLKNIKSLLIGVFLSFLTYLPYLVSEIKNGFANTNKMLDFSVNSDLREVFPFPQVHSLFMFPTNEFSVMYAANNFKKIMDFYLNDNPYFIFTLIILVLSIVLILTAFIYCAIKFFKNKEYKFENGANDKSLFLIKELFLLFLLYFPVTIFITIIGRGIAGQFRYHFGAFALSFVPMIYFLYNLKINLKFKYLNYISIFYILSAIAMTFNIIIFYKNYQEPYRWSDYIDTVQNIAKDSNGEKFIIENGNQYFSQMGFVYADKWDEVQSNANIIYYLYESKNITNLNLEIISSNGIYTVYKEIIKSQN
ncbi:hypothetical protein [Brachyspira catarrhinii]|uniref:Glycosyltransferase RgtA/B/C/D-like domain-containing protein n=1 Tax=Brachyspira catarrhinii TaxID=2528966 RepID=A0ABY2TRW6_9SPIR|nr:hypothetical protein [Brachyspira catarrhinii]TKZ35560.1 hypothetical protein EZH24_04650 [Brachyspira catarrhinii]